MIWFWLIVILAVLFGLLSILGAPYVPSQKRYLKQALTKLYPLNASDTLIDLGSGDGLVLRAAARRGATAIGYELNPLLFVLSRLFSFNYKNVQVKLANYWSASFPEGTTVIYAFAVSRDMTKMARKIQSEASRLDRPLSFITLGFPVPGMTEHSSGGPYRLYVFYPLHKNKAQV